MPRLKYRDESGQDSTLDLQGREVLIGRLAECDIVIPKGFVSRRHARIFPADGNGHWAIEDLGSSHGTYVNRLRVSEKLLEPGDQIQVGDEIIQYSDGNEDLKFRDGDTVKGTTTDRAGELPGDDGVVSSQPMQSGDLMRTMLGAQSVDLKALSAQPDKSIVQLVQPVSPGPEQTTEPPKSRESLLRADADLARQLVAVFNIVGELRACHDIDQICQVAAAKAMAAVRADRCVLALRDPHTNQFVAKIQLVDDEVGTNHRGVRVSQTMINRVVTKGEAVLVFDTEEDAALSAARSVVAQSIRSIICAPLWDGAEIIGYIYVDSNEAGRLQKVHMDLIIAVGHVAAAEVTRLRALESLREEQIRRESLARFFSADVVKHIDSEAKAGRLDPTSAQEGVVTILFADIKGFTSMSEQFRPDEVKKYLDDYFQAMTDIIIDKHQGALDKYIGDAIMALWGAPFPQGVQYDARRAIAAAVDMRNAVSALRQRRPDIYGNLQIRIGINTGKVVAGMFGSERQLNYSVIGDPVNVASRLESTGEPDRILIGEITYNLVKDVFECEDAGERKVKNREEPVRAYWVLRPKGEA